MSGIPVLLDVAGLDILIVGGGPLAARRAKKLLDAGARVRIVAREISAELRDLGAHPSLEISEREYRAGDIGDAAFVIAATDDRATNAAIANAARTSRRLVNVGDAPDEGNAVMMATHQAGPLTVGVAAGGIPGAAQRIRDEIATRFDDRYSGAIERLGALRRTMLARGDRASWTAAAERALGPDFCETVEQGTLDERMAAWR